MANLVTRIPSEELESCEEWFAPELISKNIIPVVKKEKNPRGENTLSIGEQSSAVSNETKISENESIENLPQQTIEPITADQLEKITEVAEKEGFDKGFKKGFDEAQEQGYQEGMDSAKKEIADQSERLQGIIDVLLNPLGNEQKKIEKQLLDIICQLVPAVIQKEMLIDSSSIVDVVNKSLALLPETNHQLTVYLNDQDIELIKSSLKNISAELVYQPDNSLLPGGCRLESKESSIDFSIEQRLQQVLDDFLHKRHVVDADHRLNKEVNDTIAEKDDDQAEANSSAEDNVE
ncbi:hypothetical protein AB835_12640 [Candidatus Endobugula sertula]|uniref:Flagellar assembly protein FliH n=1 Tax=Candidatus Endobugula sertula TaxID=62101 RepID=A0A1D2QMA6_9GAMM|nr:hypothetical protein AB835_12640 [Candidatus Endobugula sertula]